MNKNVRNAILWVFIVFALFSLFQSLPGVTSRQSIPLIPYSGLIENINNSKIAQVTIKGQQIIGKLKDGNSFISIIPENATPVEMLIKNNVVVEALPIEHELSLFQIFISWLPIIFFAGLIYYSFKQIQSGGNKALGFGRSKAKLMQDKKEKITFNDVAGIEEAKEELFEVVEFLKEPKKFQRLGGKIPKGVLLVGPPGTGKTLLAKAIAGEAGVPFFSISGSDFVEMFVGVGASRVRDMFDQAKKHSPCIIFIDEIDAVGRHRGVGLGGGNDEREQTLNQLLVEMDGFDENQGIIIVAATNRPDILDPALLRPGRFDRQITVSNPDIVGREQILNVHMKKLPLSSNVDVKILARGTPGFSGADLANLVNEAALIAARKNKLVVSMNDFEYAKDKVMMGVERKSMVMRDEEKLLTAYHEAGHAIIAFYLKDSDPIHKATIIPRGQALGMVMRLPENDRVSVSKKKLIADIKVAMGGRIAEEMIFGPESVTTGASSDITAATNIARKMIVEWGMSEELGFRSYAQPREDAVFGRSTKTNSEATAIKVDEEIQNVLDGAFEDAKKLLHEKKQDLELLAKTLIDKETLSGEEIQQLLTVGEILEVKTKKSKTSIPIDNNEFNETEPLTENV